MKTINFILTAIIWFLPTIFTLYFLKPIYQKAGLLPLKIDTIVGVNTILLYAIIYGLCTIVALKFHDWFKLNIK